MSDSTRPDPIEARMRKWVPEKYVQVAASECRRLVEEADRLAVERCIAIVEAVKTEYQSERETRHRILAALRADSPNPPTDRPLASRLGASFSAPVTNEAQSRKLYRSRTAPTIERAAERLLEACEKNLSTAGYHAVELQADALRTAILRPPTESKKATNDPTV